MSLEVLGVQFLAPNSTLRGGLRGFSEKTRDFRRFWSKVEFYSAGLHMKTTFKNPEDEEDVIPIVDNDLLDTFLNDV